MGERNRQLGIDFGTTTSAMAFRDDKGEVLPVLIDLERYTPTLILEEGSEAKYGKEAGDYYQSGGNLRSNFKLDLLSSDERVFSEAKDLTERYFGYLYRGYEDFEENEHRNRDANDETTIVRTIVTYPGRFPDKARDVLKNAATKAGFPNVKMVTEAEAAMMYAMKYSNNRLDRIAQGNEGKPMKIMMIDMGGGTMDIAIFLYDVQNRILDQRPLFYPSKGRGSNFGGREIDELLTEFYEGCSETPLTRSPAEHRDLVINIKAHKERWISTQLNQNQTAKAPLVLWQNTRARINRAQFEDILKDYLKKFPELVNGALDAAESAGKTEDHDVDAVIFTGGNSQWYFVKKMLLNPNLIRLPKVQAEPERIVKYVTENNLNYALTIIAMGAACYGKQPTAAPAPQPAASPKQKNTYDSTYEKYRPCPGDCLVNWFGRSNKGVYCESYCVCNEVCTVFDEKNCEHDTYNCHEYTCGCDYHCFHQTCSCDDDDYWYLECSRNTD